MNVFYILDPTTVAIAVPQIVLWGLIAAAAHQKRCYPWPSPVAVPAIGLGADQLWIENVNAAPSRNLSTLESVRAELWTYFLCVAVASATFVWCSEHLFRTVYFPLNDLHLMIPVLNNMLIGWSLTLPILCFRQIALFRHGARANLRSRICSSQFLLSMGILLTAISLTLPLIQVLGIVVGLSADSAHVMRDVLRMFVAVSTIPSSMAGLAVASSGMLLQRRNNKAALEFMKSDDVAALDAKSVDELHYLIEIALKHGKLMLLTEFRRIFCGASKTAKASKN